MAGSQAARAVELALSKLGAPYVWATAAPDTFDCSGFTWWIACQVLGPQDYELRSSHHQFNAFGEAVTEPRAGDLAYFDIGQGVIMGNRAGHVGMLIDGERFVHAANESLGVRVDRLDADWYAPKSLGYRRVYDRDAENSRNMHSVIAGATMGFLLPLMHGAIRTPNQWNGGPFPVDWDGGNFWQPVVMGAAEEAGVDARVVFALGMMETQFMQERNGKLLTVWDDSPGDGPSVGIMQVKPQVWGWLRPDLDPSKAGDNIRLGAAVIRYLIDEQGGNLEAAVRRWYPGKDVERYLATFWGLMGEMGYGA
ncbi:MAG: C40 family peptidase [Thermomicrobiales bacterium]|nr:C40 family peptidase [Thermomicrobiales bacterium]